MKFDELNEDNFQFFAVKNYENPQAITREDFEKDLNHFRYIKRLLKRKRKEFINKHVEANFSLSSENFS